MMRKKNYDDDDEMVRDGGVVRVPLHLMDARQRAVFDAYGRMTADASVRDARRFTFDADDHRPHYASVPDAVRRARNQTYDSYVRRLQDAWKSPGRDAAPEPDESELPGDEPDEPEDQGGRMRRHLRAEESDQAQARRDAAYRAYGRSLFYSWY